jgi:hypothetical protein
MARFHGEVGYASAAVESAPGVWKDTIVERTYFGDAIRTNRRLQEGDSLNKDIVVNNSISIVADAYAAANFSAIRYVRWNGALWTVVDVEVQRPRLLLRLGGVYNGPTP